MANIFQVEPPRWLQEIARPIDAKATGQVLGLLLAGATNASRNDVSFTEGFQQANKNLHDPNWALREKQAELAMIGQAAQTMSAWQMMDLRSQETAAWLKDLPAIREYSTLPIEKQIETPLSGMQSRQGNALAMQINRAAGASAVAKSMNESKSSYDKRVAEIVKADPEVGTGLALNPTQFPSPTNWRALEVAEQRVGIRRENRKMEEEIQALERGDETTTRVDEKGNVTKTFKPATSATAYEPKTKELSDGTTLVWNPKSGAYSLVKDKVEKQLTATQLQAIAKQIEISDPASASIIKKFLTDSAVEQVKGSAPKDPTPSPGAMSFDDFQKWRQSQ